MYKLQNKCKILLHIKEYNTSGKRRKYSVHVKLDYPGKMIASEQADWDLNRTIHKTFTNVLRQIKKIYRKDSSHRKEYE